MFFGLPKEETKTFKVNYGRYKMVENHCYSGQHNTFQRFSNPYTSFVQNKPRSCATFYYLSDCNTVKFAPNAGFSI